MKRRERTPLLALVVLVILLASLALLLGVAGTAQGAGSPSPLTITAVSPAPNSVVSSTTPVIEVTFNDSVAPVNPSAVYMFVDGANVSGVQNFTVSAARAMYTPPSILFLKNGNHTVTVDATDLNGNTASLTWNFTVNTAITSAPGPLAGVKVTTLLLYIGIGALVSGAVVGGYILVLKQTTRFTFRKYFATHPVERKITTIYIPLIVTFVWIILGLDYVYGTPGLPSNAPDYVFIVGIFIALTLFGIDARREMLRIRTFERAFAQLLFEMADAMRGGLDPAKAVVELSKTHTNILRKPLRVAADGVRLGRPFDKVLRDMVRPMHSELISRYAGLIADATSIGGETATVVYRAAKDMDDFVKIEEEREKQLILPVAVIYIAFGVLMAVLLALLSIAPELGTLNINFLGFGTPLSTGAATAAPVPHLSFDTLKERFFELMLINALGTGAIIGAFTEGRARYGILHSLALVAATAVVFFVLYP
ncbi:MAG TPA: type II secretion system F family protein [Thermoplasmata archaeon]|nr:type II secretion system F family protein [Thermoplasmata archaeon]